MHRFYLPPEQCRGAALTLTGPEAHHARHVLRVQPHQRVAVLDGAGHEFLCEVASVEARALRLEVRQRQDLPALPYCLTLIQAITKARSLEMIVQKATELGASRILPVQTERTVVSMSAEEGRRKAAKWTAIAVEALKQSGAPWLPVIERPASPQEVLGRGESFDLMLVASLQPGSRHPRACVEAYRVEHGRSPRTVAVWIGPEGDFTPAELNTIQAGGALPVTLGPLVMRSETAALYCLSILRYELQAGAFLASPAGSR